MALSKKQQKAQAFRAKHKGKRNAEDVPDVPEADIEAEEEEAVAPEPEGKRGDKSGEKKRKRDADDDGADKSKDKSKGKTKDKGKAKAEDDDGAEPGPKPKKSKEAKQRFILFLGNLGFRTTREDVAKHFYETLGRMPSVRLLTERATSKNQPAKSRGIAFLELASSTELQSCLRLHHSILNGRRINVELTAGGGGKSDARRGRIEERNKRVGGQRERRAEREKEEGGGEGEGEGEGEGADGAGEADTAPAGFKIRNGRRVRVKGKTDDGARPAKRARHDDAGGALPGWAARSGSGQRNGGGGRRKWEPTGANAVAVG